MSSQDSSASTVKQMADLDIFEFGAASAKPALHGDAAASL
jgi:hypothetical protein